MEGDHWPHRSCDGAGRNLARLRDRASQFFESLSVAELARERHRHLWISDWLRVADDYRTLAESARETRSSPIAGEAWLCSLTALEVVRSLSCPGDAESADLADEVSTSLRGLETEAGLAIERVKIDCFDQGALAGFFLPAFRRESAAPAVICVGDEDATLGSMMSRLLPASLCGAMSLLLIDAGNSTVHRSFKPEHRLQFWLDYLEARPDVDARRIAIYGEGAGACHASRLALSDRRIAAAVCDGGLAMPVMRQAALRWMTGFEQAVPDAASREALLPQRRVPCPLLMVVGSRSMMWEQDALELQADYRQIGADCTVVVPNNVPHPLGEVENFIAVDDFIFEWLDSKLGTARQLDPVTRL
ncbi:alpha/beta hydrolase [Bradyrhizobium forestalis]|uniref:Alpha/beta hydrolase n=1 Tax=Bradyrhizobium forestalis TaxID=1419263 RepID=A0A2M8RBE0_9BRAD|nr:alpha/beta hydrolase [Bradyrhizobium forestalis]PJG55143.1 alpha/beta hydrolase [Bradyrhizobium forestalis]